MSAITDTSAPAPRNLVVRRLAQVSGLWADSLLRNSALIMANTVVTSLLGYAFWVLAARLYPPATVGLGSAVVGLMTITAIVGNVGVAGALVQRLPGRARGAEWSTSLSAGIIGALCSGTIGGAAVVAVLGASGGELSAVAATLSFAGVFVVGVAAWALSIVLDFAFIAERSSGHMLARGTLFGVVRLLLLVAIAAFGATALGLFSSWVLGAIIASAAGLALQVPRLGRDFRFRLRVRRELKAISRSVAGNHFISIGNVLPTYLLPTVIVSRLAAEEGAYFYMTWMVGGAFFMVSSAVGSSLFAEGSNDPSMLGRRIRSALKMTALLLVPAMLFMIAFGESVLGLFGADYAAAGATLLLLLTISAIPDAVTNLYVARLRVERRLAVGASLTLGTAAIALFGSWLLLPELGIAAVGWAWLTAKLVGSVAVAIDVLRRRG